MSEETPQKRPMTVTFNVEYNRGPTRSSTRTYNQPASEGATLRPQSRKITANLKTADLSHISDSKTIPNVPTFIPKEFAREVKTPIPLKEGMSTHDADNNQWLTPVFPSPAPTDTRQEVENLGQWLNSVLEKNQKETKDPIELATNARKWFTIAYEELCRQVSAESPEGSTLLLSIWKRYQELFARVVQLHQEEKTYLVNCHKERTSALKQQVDQTQAKLKQITQQYRDDQERWSNSRERDETKFANMRKKLDLQVKNKRSLHMQIKALREQLESGKPIEKVEEQPPVEEQEEKKPEVNTTNHQVSEKAHNMRQNIKKDYPYMYDTIGALDDISRISDQDRQPSMHTRELFPSILHDLPPIRPPKIRSLKWCMAAFSHFYALRLSNLCSKKPTTKYTANRQHFAEDIYHHLISLFGSPVEAAETFFDLVETAKQNAANGNRRCRLFLQFIDAQAPYRDPVFLDFYCFCLGNFIITNTQQTLLFEDKLDENPPVFSPCSGSIAIDLAKKVLYSISEGVNAEGYLNNMKEELKISNDDEQIVSEDVLLDYLVNCFATEENRMMDQLHEQYDMDAAQYGGIVTLGQFQTLAMFSSKKLASRGYLDMMRDTFSRTMSTKISFQDLVEAMHRQSMLVPISFERVDYNVDTHLDDIFAFMKEEYNFHMPEIEAKLERARKTDNSLFKQLNAAKSKFEQVVESKRAGPFTEDAQRELYEKLRSTTLE